jgi:hypothetical protein
MMQDFVIGNMIWNAGLVSIAAFLIKRWMDRIEATAKENRDKVDLIYQELKIANGRTSKIEARVLVQEARCEERTHEGRAPCMEDRGL